MAHLYLTIKSARATGVLPPLRRPSPAVFVQPHVPRSSFAASPPEPQPPCRNPIPRYAAASSSILFVPSRTSLLGPRPRHRRRRSAPSPLPRSATGGPPVPGIAADPLRRWPPCVAAVTPHGVSVTAAHPCGASPRQPGAQAPSHRCPPVTSTSELARRCAAPSRRAEPAPFARRHPVAQNQRRLRGAIPSRRTGVLPSRAAARSDGWPVVLLQPRHSPTPCTRSVADA